MSVSNLRMELGDYLNFSPSMLPKNILSDSAKNYRRLKFILQSSNKAFEESENSQAKTPAASEPMEETKTPQNKSTGDTLGLNQEEVLKMFAAAQENSVKELSRLYDTDNLSENDYMQNPFFKDNNE